MSGPSAGKASRPLYLSGLSYRALYRNEPWLREFVHRSDARRVLLIWRWGALTLFLAVFALLLGTLGYRPWLVTFLIADAACAVTLAAVTGRLLERARGRVDGDR